MDRQKPPMDIQLSRRELLTAGGLAAAALALTAGCDKPSQLSQAQRQATQVAQGLPVIQPTETPPSPAALPPAPPKETSVANTSIDQQLKKAALERNITPNSTEIIAWKNLENLWNLQVTTPKDAYNNRVQSLIQTMRTSSVFTDTMTALSMRSVPIELSRANPMPQNPNVDNPVRLGVSPTTKLGIYISYASVSTDQLPPTYYALRIAYVESIHRQLSGRNPNASPQEMTRQTVDIEENPRNYLAIQAKALGDMYEKYIRLYGSLNGNIQMRIPQMEEMALQYSICRGDTTCWKNVVDKSIPRDPRGKV